MNKEIIERLVEANEGMKVSHICPRCGKVMCEDNALNSVSRYADVYICSDCGTDEAMRGAFGGGSLAFSEWQIWKELIFSMSDSSARKRLVEGVPSGLYDGMNSDGEAVILRVQQGQGMVIMTVHASKPNWYECVEYDKDGEQCGVTYEPKK